MTPKFLAAEVVPYSSIEIVRATHCGCGVRLVDHVDGWDGKRLDCTEARRRNGFRAFLADPTTGPRLDAMLADNDATDAAILAEREERGDDELSGSACGAACGFCGRCS